MKIINRDKLPESKFANDGLKFILDKLDASTVITRLSEYAYVLATIFHETNTTFEPVIEGYWIKQNRVSVLYNFYVNNYPHNLATIFPNGRDEPHYEGRGYVQLTHNYNYNKFGEMLGIDLFGNPDIAMQPEIAWKILELGMSKGLFTGKKLSDYFNDNRTNFYRARKIINGMDRAQDIANIANSYFYKLEFIEV